MYGHTLSKVSLFIFRPLPIDLIENNIDVLMGHKTYCKGKQHLIQPNMRGEIHNHVTQL